MLRLMLIAATVTLAVFPATTRAQHMMNHDMHHAMSLPDGREQVDFPPQMQTIFLGNMRDHVETLNNLLQAVASGDLAGASKIAADRLGLDSPSAAGCKPAAAGGISKPPAPGSMEEMMALYMPAPMREIGLSMHNSASAFAEVAARAAATNDTASAIEALSRITPNCVACHAAYRLR